MLNVGFCKKKRKMAQNVEPGNPIYVDVTIQNTGTKAGTAYIRVSLVRGATSYDLISHVSNELEVAVTLNPGEISSPMPFSIVLPTNAELGLYDSVSIVRTGPNLTGDVLDEETQSDQVEILEAPGEGVAITVKIVDEAGNPVEGLQVSFFGGGDVTRIRTNSAGISEKWFPSGTVVTTQVDGESEWLILPDLIDYVEFTVTTNEDIIREFTVRPVEVPPPPPEPTGGIIITLVNAFTGVPITGTVVFPGLGITLDIEATFTQPTWNLPVGTHTYRASSSGFNSYSSTIQSVEGTTRGYNIGLRP